MKKLVMGTILALMAATSASANPVGDWFKDAFSKKTWKRTSCVIRRTTEFEPIKIHPRSKYVDECYTVKGAK